MSDIKQLLRYETSQNLANASLSATTDFGTNWMLRSVYVHVSGNITETVTLTFKSRTSANYNTTITAVSLSTQANTFLAAGSGYVFQTDDELTITCTSANHTGTIYVTVLGEPWGRQAAGSTTNPGL